MFCNEELGADLCVLSAIVRTGWAGYVTWMNKLENMYSILVKKCLGSNNFS
jgi:hypothetical protein